MGGDNNRAQRAAEQREDQRQAKIVQGTSAVNAAFDNPGRQAQYDDFLDASRQLYTDRVNEANRDAGLDATFALARSGLTGGSRDRDLTKTLGQKFTQGLLRADQLAQSDVGRLRDADQSAKSGLLALVQGGLDAGTAAANSAAALRTSLASNAPGQQVDALGDLFGSIAATNAKSEAAQERRQAARDYGNSIYQPTFAWGGP
jgi:hypothetical protein